MALLSESMIALAEADPINDQLKAFLATFTSTYPSAKDRLNGRDLALRLIGTLQLLPAASALPSKGGDGPLSGEIALLYSSLSSRRTGIKLIAGLLRAIVAQEEDQEIWTKIYEVVARTRPLPQPTTPPPSRPSFTSSFQQTPWSFNTGSFADISEHRTQVDGALKAELLPGLRLDIPDFVAAVFGQVSQLDKLAEEVFDKCQDGDTPLYLHGSGWTKWPTSGKEELVLQWLQDLIERFLIRVNDRVSQSTARRQIYQGPTVYLDGSPIKRKMDVGIMVRHEQSKDDGDRAGEETSISNWAEILVTGELKSNPIEDGQTPAWLGLATYAREVFRAQERRFVLGFTLCGSVMRLWQFDRSGSSGSSSFDINEDGFKFVYAMLGYFLMNNKQLGLDPTIHQLEGRRYVEITRNGQIERLMLTQLIKKQAVIAGRATTCWEAYRDGDESKESLIVKDSWQYEERPEEGELIKEATDKGVQNIARYYHHETVQVDGINDDISQNVRRGMMKKWGRIAFTQRSITGPESSISESLGRTAASRSISRKRSSSSTRMAPPPSAKRSCSNPRSIQPEMPTHNRIRRRVITRDVGKAIHEATSLMVVLNGVIGAIKGHKSLLDVGILHRDISQGNIMLTGQEDGGFLIDLDLAVKLNDSTASGAPSKTGTKVFMAIGALRGEHHNPMHDWESIFWVLFWVCIHWDGPQRKRRIVKEFENWNKKSIEELAKLKMGLVLEDDGFNKEMSDNFSKYCRPLVPCMRQLRKVVFPDGRRWLREDRVLYSQMVQVLERARRDLTDEVATK